MSFLYLGLLIGDQVIWHENKPLSYFGVTVHAASLLSYFWKWANGENAAFPSQEVTVVSVICSCFAMWCRQKAERVRKMAQFMLSKVPGKVTLEQCNISSRKSEGGISWWWERVLGSPLVQKCQRCRVVEGSVLLVGLIHRVLLLVRVWKVRH